MGLSRQRMKNEGSKNTETKSLHRRLTRRGAKLGWMGKRIDRQEQFLYLKWRGGGGRVDRRGRKKSLKKGEKRKRDAPLQKNVPAHGRGRLALETLREGKRQRGGKRHAREPGPTGEHSGRVEGERMKSF